MLRKFRFVIAGLLIIVANQAVSYAVSAAVPSSLLAAGTTRYALVEKETQLNIVSFSDWEPTLLATSVTVPTGKTADVIVLFCGVASSGNSFIKVRARLGTALLVPNAGGTGISLSSLSSSIQSKCVNFYKTGVGAGTKTVAIEWHAASSLAHLFSRSMIVILNIH